MDFSWSEAVGALLHETGHTAGLLHEHQRPDRDQFVTAPAVMDPDSQIVTTGIPFGPYDCHSVMHYYISSSDSTAFRTKAPGCLYAFRGVTLSRGDAQALQSLYWGCTWAPRGIAAHDIGVGVDGGAWVIGNQPVPGGFDILRWDGVQWLTVPGGAERISASSANSAWVVNSANAIFEFVSSGWTLRPGAAQDIAACADGSAWAIGANPVPGGFGIFRWDGSSWNPLPGGATRIAARSRDDAVVVNDSGQVFEFNPRSGNWTLLPGGIGSVHDVAIGPEGTVGVSHHQGIISFFSRERGQWADIDSPPLRFAPPRQPRPIELAIGPNGLPWIVDVNRTTYERTALAP